MCAVNRLTSEFFLCFPTTYLCKKDDSVKRRINATGVSKNIRTKSSYNAIITSSLKIWYEIHVNCRKKFQMWYVFSVLVANKSVINSINVFNKTIIVNMSCREITRGLPSSPIFWLNLDVFYTYLHPVWKLRIWRDNDCIFVITLYQVIETLS